MCIGELSKGSGISTSCIRYCEKHGVIRRAAVRSAPTSPTPDMIPSKGVVL